MSADDCAPFDEAVRANQDTRDYRRRLAARLDEVRNQQNVPLDLPFRGVRHWIATELTLHDLRLGTLCKRVRADGRLLPGWRGQDCS